MLQALVAFAIAAVISVTELTTSKYPRTYFLLLRQSRALYIYAAIYGIIGFAVAFGLDALTAAGVVKLQGFGLSSPWGRAVAVGLTIKAILHINLFSVTVGSQSTPFGLETIVALFEPSLLRTVTLDEFSAVRTYIDPVAAKYPDLARVKTAIKNNVPGALPASERAAFANDIDNASTVVQAMEIGLRFFGRRNFTRIFP